MNTLEHKIINGLLPTTPDEEDFLLGALYDLPDPKTLPEDFDLEDFPAQNQGLTGFCSGYGTAGMSSLQEGKVKHPTYAYALGQLINKTEWGQQSRPAMKAHVTYGDIDLADAPDMTPQHHDEAFLRDIKNWPPELLEKAKEGKKQSFFRVTGPYDAFDNIRGAIYYFREKRRAASAGIIWKWRMQDIFLPGANKDGTGHFTYYRGWKTVNGVPYLILRNSAGPEAGQNGDHLVGREEVNFYVKIFESFMFVDISKEDAKYYLSNGISPENSAIYNTAYVIRTEIIALFSKLIDAYRLLLELTKKQNMKRTLLDAIIQVESEGNDRAIGDKWLANPAYGCLQIRQPAVDDYNRWNGTTYNAKDCLGNRELSIKVFNAYAQHYATSARLGHIPTDEDIARNWNGGPNGYKKLSTLVYWSKVKRAMGA